jgi:hypothetical protein
MQQFCVTLATSYCIQGKHHLTNDEAAKSYHVTMIGKTCSDSQNSYSPRNKRYIPDVKLAEECSMLTDYY